MSARKYIPLVNGGKLFIQATAPAGIDKDIKNLWLDTSSTAGVLKVWDTSGEDWAAATVADGAVTTAKLAAGVVSANAAGIALFANDFWTAAAVLAKFAADSFDNAELLKLIKDGAFKADAATRALFADGVFPLAKLTATAKYRILNYRIEDLGAGVDIAARAIFQAPTGLDIDIISAGIIPEGSSAGVDDSNTAVIALTDGTNTLVTKTYNTSAQPPAANALGDLGAISSTYKTLSAGEKLYVAVTQGATANLPALMLQVVYSVADAA